VLFTDRSMKSIRARHLLTEELCLVMPAAAGHLCAHHPMTDSVPLCELETIGIVISTASNGLRQLVEQAFNSIGIRPRLVGELNTVTLLKEAVMAGVASTILPMSAVASESRTGLVHVRRIVEPLIARPISICSNSNIPLSAAAEAVQLVAVETIESLVDLGVWQNVVAAQPRAEPSI
jgi:LysR family nitrogen assimilation transcriptional regulator